MEVISRLDIAQPGDVVLVTTRSRPGGNYGDAVEYRTFAAEALTPGIDSDRALAAAGVYVAAGGENWQPGSVGLPGERAEWGVIGVEVIGRARPWGKVQTTAGRVARGHARRLGRELRAEGK